MRTDANIHETEGLSVTVALPALNPPVDFRHYRARQDLIEHRRRATPVRREQINILIQQLDEYQRTKNPLMAANIARQMKLLAL